MERVGINILALVTAITSANLHKEKSKEEIGNQMHFWVRNGKI